MTTLEVLELAEKRLEKNWRRGAVGGYCVLTAVDHFSCKPECISAKSRLYAAFRTLVPTLSDKTIVYWNDHVATHGDVMAVVKWAIQLEKDHHDD